MVVCLGRKSKGRPVGTVLAWDKGGIVAAWAPLSPTVALLWAFSCCAHRQEHQLASSHPGRGCLFVVSKVRNTLISFLKYTVFSSKGLLTFTSFDLYEGIMGSLSSIIYIFELMENDVLWYFRAQQDHSVCGYVTCITAPQTACSKRLKQSRSKKCNILQTC